PPSSATPPAAVAARSAAIIDQPIHEPLPEAGVKDVVTSTDQNSVAAIATKRVAAISRPASAAVTASAARSARSVATSEDRRVSTASSPRYAGSDATQDARDAHTPSD